MSSYDCRAELFRERGFEVLGSVVQGTQITRPDPFDVGEIHSEARRAFADALLRVRGDGASRILLIRGEAGCGKTHLIRSLRTQAHRQHAGVIAYVHMTAEQGDYSQYLLRQVIRSLSDSYEPSENQGQSSSALDLLSDALVTIGGFDPKALEQLRETDDHTLAKQVDSFSDKLIDLTSDNQQPRFGQVDLNTLRILLYRQSVQKSIRRRVSSFLNGDPLSAMDWAKLEGMPAQCNREPLYLLGQLARVTTAALGMPLIICVDQIEASDVTGKNHDPFIHAMSSACELVENVPDMMVLLSCLDSAYNIHAPHLISAYRHRIENDPPPVLLTAARTGREIRQIVSKRLRSLYESEKLVHIPPDSVYPIPESMPEELQSQAVRIVLQSVHGYWQKCQAAPVGALAVWSTRPVRADKFPDTEETTDRLRIAWNEFSTSGEQVVSDEDDKLLALLRWALQDVQHDLDEGTTVSLQEIPAPPDQPTVPVLGAVIQIPRLPAIHRLIALCDKDPRGGGLDRQLKALQSIASRRNQPVVILRSTQFTKTGKAAERLASLNRDGAQAIVMADTWKLMQAFRQFLETKARVFPSATVVQWRRSDKPLAMLPGISAIVEIPRAVSTLQQAGVPSVEGPVKRDPIEISSPSDRPQVEKAVATTAPTAKPPTIARRSQPSPSSDADAKPQRGKNLLIGKTDGFSSVDVSIDSQSLCRHTAIFGANGSGKTVLALSIVEMLLERGVNVVLFDRKGDLASYALPSAWEQPGLSQENIGRREALRARLSVELYTPGSANGRPLVLPLLPQSLNRLSPDEQKSEAQQSAMILVDICQPSKSKADTFAAILTSAITVMCGSDQAYTLEDLQQMLLSPPQELMQMLPAHTGKDFIAVGRQLSERRIVHSRLFNDQGEKLDLTRMLNEGRNPRLTIISTQFLQGAALIWIAQFLSAAGQYILRHPFPQGRLGALLMFDEADQYVPATSKPATKTGMENLLRRARSAGVGVMLASQNVGDFDYKALDNVVTTFSGKLTTPRAMEKLRPRLGTAVDRLAKKTAGQFILENPEGVKDIRAILSLIRPEPLALEEIESLAAKQPSN